MPRYRIFVLHGDKRTSCVELAETCSTDDDALAEAGRLVSDERGAEVWDQFRLVGRLAPRGRKRAPGCLDRFGKRRWIGGWYG